MVFGINQSGNRNNGYPLYKEKQKEGERRKERKRKKMLEKKKLSSFVIQSFYTYF
jgi:hypothetical protein